MAPSPHPIGPAPALEVVVAGAAVQVVVLAAADEGVVATLAEADDSDDTAGGYLVVAIAQVCGSGPRVKAAAYVVIAGTGVDRDTDLRADEAGVRAASAVQNLVVGLGVNRLSDAEFGRGGRRDQHLSADGDGEADNGEIPHLEVPRYPPRASDVDARDRRRSNLSIRSYNEWTHVPPSAPRPSTPPQRCVSGPARRLTCYVL
ncbi:MAG: hypothetical protein M3R66_17750 [Actinomycetota bacterium]|nr:hypothetical protein [Actinomycetota bacterium]